MSPRAQRLWLILIACMRALARVLPTTMLYRISERGIVGGIHRFVRAAPAIPSLVPVASALPPALVDAAVQRGGFVHIEDTLRRNQSTVGALIVTYLLLPARRRLRMTTTTGAELLSHQDGRPTILLCPHLGPYLFGFVHLAEQGHALSIIAVTDPRSSGPIHAMIEALGAKGSPPIEYVRADHPTAALQAERALRRHQIVVWQPDTPIALSSSPKAIVISFLGMDIAVSPAMIQVARRANARLVTCVVVRPDPRRPDACIQLVEVPVDLTHPVDQVTRDVYVAVERSVLAQIDEWTIWRFVDQFRPPGHSSS